MTEHDCRGGAPTHDSVGMGAYNMDSHNCQRYVTPDGVRAERGRRQVCGRGPYRSLPRARAEARTRPTTCSCRCASSSSHIAFGSIRMEPVFMMLGQSAATAAALAIDEGVAVQDVPYAKLRERLLKDGQVLEICGTSSIAAPDRLGPARR